MSSIESESLEFSLKLFLELSSKDNLVFSPLSLSTCLSMLLMATRSTCSEELSKSLFGKAIAHNEYESIAKQLKSFADKTLKSNSEALSSANFIYTQKDFPVLPKFKQLVENYFYAKSQELDFLNQNKKSLEVINSDIKSATNGKIDKILEDIDKQTVMVLANALYFKGLWGSKFRKEVTQTDKFTTNTNQQIDVQMMFQSQEFPFHKSQQLRAKAIELNYKNSNSVLIVILPNKDSSLTQLRPNLSIKLINDLVKSLRPIKVDLSLPKFKLESSLDLIPILKKLGIKGVFDDKSADFSGMTDTKGLYVSTIIQKAVIEVNEEGTEAAAATAIGVQLMCAQINAQFKANRPFLYLLVTKNEQKDINSILFIGECNNPKV